MLYFFTASYFICSNFFICCTFGPPTLMVGSRRKYVRIVRDIWARAGIFFAEPEGFLFCADKYRLMQA